MRNAFIHSKRAAQTSLFGLCAWLLPLAVTACPICNTETGQQVRAGIFGDDFWSTLLVVVSPFPVLLLVIAAYHFGWPRTMRPSTNDADISAFQNPTKP